MMLADYQKETENWCRFAIAAVLAFAGCSSGSAPYAAPAQVEPMVKEQSGFKVSVSSNGTTVSDFETQLVHRLELSESQVRVLKENMVSNCGCGGSIMHDGAGKLAGVKMTRIEKGSPLLEIGLKNGDILTAIGVTPVTDIQQIDNLFVSLLKDKTASLTFQRSGHPHKMFFYLSGK